MSSTLTGGRTNVNNTAVPHFSSTDATGNTGASDDDASALMIALATACDPSSGFSRLDHGWARTNRSEKLTQTTALARHGMEYRQALQKAIKKSSSFQKSMTDDVNALFRVANCRRKDKDEGAGTCEVDHLDVDDLFKDALTNGMVTPQVTGDTNTNVGLNAPHRPPGRHIALLSKYVSPEEMLSNINEVDLHVPASPTTSGNDCRTTLHSNFKLRPRSRTLERLRDQLSDSALQVPNMDSTASSRSKSLPIYMCSSSASGSNSLYATTGATSSSPSTSSPDLPYLNNLSVCKEEKSPQSSPPIQPMSTLASSKKSTSRTSSRVVASDFPAVSKNIAHNRPLCFLQRKNAFSSSAGLTRSFSALTLRRSTSTSTFKNATRNDLDRKNSTCTTNIKEAKKKSPSHPNLRRSASSKTSFRRRSSRGSFSSLRRHKVGIHHSYSS